MLSCVQLFATTWTAACQASLPFSVSRSLLKLISIELVIPCSYLILCCPLLLPPSIFPSIRVFSNESALRIRWPKYWSYSFNVSPSNEHPGLISFRMDWLDLLAVQGLSRVFSCLGSGISFSFSISLMSFNLEQFADGRLQNHMCQFFIINLFPLFLFSFSVSFSF